VGVQPYTVKPSTLVTCRQTWIYFLTTSALHYILYLWSHYTVKRGYTSSTDQPYIISLVTLYRQTWIYFLNRSALHYILYLWSHSAGKLCRTFSTDHPNTINPSSLVTLYRQTWSYLNISVLHHKSFISGHIIPANVVTLPQQISPTL
jgi:hypothetical protein